ncbi:hypothetical protein JZM24_03505 [Candidatus Sodalis endolongispinus]|uniref:Uncharacterized protein n=1 Tax=Candidatus Sodalis endolongispinus TaxID=2812662 RepID=A0ABS5Y8W9_9GAMM|nr:hypothetical protein [Candidatus Sodalis endolongispinus]MBT9431457.1 hypothetical protein [Candidatus Sodalis endolongispinus]
MSNTNANFDMTGILLGQEVRKRKTPQEKMAIIQQSMEPGHIKIGVSVRHIFKPISYLEIQLLSGVSGG